MRDIKDLSDSYLLEQGIVMLTGPVDRVSAQVVVCQMQYLASKYPERPIQFWINSPGGDVTAGLAIYDVMNYVNTEVHTVAIGMAASMAAILLSSGTRGHGQDDGTDRGGHRPRLHHVRDRSQRIRADRRRDTHHSANGKTPDRRIKPGVCENQGMPRNGAPDGVGASFFVLSEGAAEARSSVGILRGAFSERVLRGRCSAVYGGVRGRVHAVFICACAVWILYECENGREGKIGS